MKSCAYSKCINRKFIADALKLAEKMLSIAEKGVHTCEEDSCLVLYGVIRDCGYKIRRSVEQEQVLSLQKSHPQKVLH